MIQKWAKVLPYGIVMFITKKFTSDFIESPQLGKCNGFRIDKGEWVLFSKQNYNRMREQERKNRETKLEKKKIRIHKILDNDYSLKNAIKEDFRQEENETNGKWGNE